MSQGTMMRACRIVTAVAALSLLDLGRALRDAGCGPFEGCFHSNHTRSVPDEDGLICCCRSKHHSMCRPFDAEDSPQGCPSSGGYKDFSKLMGDGATRPEECTKAAEERRGRPKRVVIKVYWMRHGLSCSNIIGLQGLPPVKERLGNSFFKGKFHRLREAMSKEPVLSDAAVARAGIFGAIIRARLREELGEAAAQIPIFSSMMMRAMLTALMNFPGKKVRPLPYVGESSNWKCNYPLEWEEQKAKMSRLFDNATVNRLSFDLCEAEHPARDGKESRHDYGMFKKFFPSLLEAHLANEGISVREGQEIPVVIVSHSEYMLKYLKSCESHFGGRKPFNNEVWEQKYLVDLGAKEQEMVEEGSCKEFLEGKADLFPPLGLDMLCKGDIEYCPEINEKVEEWLERDRARCDAVGNLGILERDWQAGMKYTKEFDFLRAEGMLTGQDIRKGKLLRSRSSKVKKSKHRRLADVIEKDKKRKKSKSNVAEEDK